MIQTLYVCETACLRATSLDNKANVKVNLSALTASKFKKFFATKYAEKLNVMKGKINGSKCSDRRSGNFKN